jgi:hypothetical protein
MADLKSPASESKEPLRDEERNVYNPKARRKLVRQGKIDPEEAAFMRGYEDAAGKEEE